MPKQNNADSKVPETASHSKLNAETFKDKAYTADMELNPSLVASLLPCNSVITLPIKELDFKHSKQSWYFTFERLKDNTDDMQDVELSDETIDPQLRMRIRFVFGSEKYPRKALSIRQILSLKTKATKANPSRTVADDILDGKLSGVPREIKFLDVKPKMCKDNLHILYYPHHYVAFDDRIEILRKKHIADGLPLNLFNPWDIIYKDRVFINSLAGTPLRDGITEDYCKKTFNAKWSIDGQMI